MIMRKNNDMIRYMVHNTVHTIIRRRGRLFSALSLLLLMLTSGAGSAFAQTTDYSGTYYIASTGYNANTPEDNFYLCPTEDYIYYKPDNSWSTDGTTYPNPFITTYKCKTNAYHNGDASDAVWIIIKHPTENYYYIKHKSDGKYMVSNGQLSDNSGANRLRVHLETVAEANLDDKELFSIEPYLTYLVISPKSSAGWNLSGGEYKWYTVNKGNKNSLKGDGTNDGPNKKNTGGIIGIFTQSDANAKFYLEDYVTKPTFVYNTSNQIEITAAAGTTLIYTIDGTIPSASNGTPVSSNTVSITPAANVTTIKAVAVYNGELSKVATFTPPVLCGTSHKYLIQSQNNAWNGTDFHYYMIPGDETNSVLMVNTTSLFRPSMEWYFMGAGVENGVQYYYIVNNTNGKYLCYDNSKVCMENYSVDNKFKFSIVESPTAGTFNIKPYGQNKYLYKDSNNSTNKIIGLNSSTTSEDTRWKFVKKTALDRTAPFTVSDGNAITYYQLRSSGDEFYINAPASANTNATMVAAASANENTYWYFEQAATATDNDWLAYYYIRNALTGDYLYYANDNPSNNNAAFKTSESNGDAGRYQFTWARSTDQGLYFMVPKMLRDETLNNISTMNRYNTTLRVQKVRATGTSAWSFVSVDFCNDPSISQAANGDITITCPTPGTEIYYTLNGSTPTDQSLRYTGTFTPAIGSTGVKAIAVIQSDHNVQSSIVEHEFVAYTAPNISFNGISIITITAGSGASVYYTTDGTEPSTQSNLYNGSFTINNAATIKAIAVHTGFLTSQVAQLSIEQVATPTSTYNQENGSITISCATEGATFYYTLDGSTPTRNSTLYSGPLTAGISGKTIKVLAVKDNMLNSEVYTSNPVTIQCAPPTFRRIDATTVQLVCSIPTDGVTFYYTTGTTADDTGEPTSSSNPGSTITFDPDDLPIYIKAIATAQGYINSTVAGRSIGADLNQD